MATLAQLLASHGCILVLDAASANVQVGLLRRGAPPVWQRSPEESGRALFTGTEACLRDTGLGWPEVRAFLFCEGPGSMLGVRTAAMAIRTWQVESPRPAYRYQSLAILAHQLQVAGSPAPFSVIADARRESWHRLTVGATGVGKLERVATPVLASSGELLFQPAAFRSWARPPRAARDCAYDVAALLAATGDLDLFTPTDAPDTFQHEAPVYKKWSAQVHSAATASRP